MKDTTISISGSLKSGRNIVVNVSRSAANVVSERYLFKNKPLVEGAGPSGTEKRVETWNGHTGLNGSSYVIRKHNNAKCEFCEEEESVFLFFWRYESARERNEKCSKGAGRVKYY